MSLEEKYPKLGFTDDLQFEITQNALLVMAVNQAADVFDLKTGKCLHKFEIKPTQMELLADDTLVLFHDKNATSYDLYDMKTFDLIQSIDCEHIPKSISKSPDGNGLWNSSNKISQLSLWFQLPKKQWEKSSAKLNCQKKSSKAVRLLMIFV